MDRPVEVIHCTDSNDMDKAFPGAPKRISGDRRDVPQEKFDHVRAVRLRWGASGVQ